LLRVDTEDTHELSVNETELFINSIIELLNRQKIDAILFQDYNKGVLTPELINTVIQEANQRNIPTAVDPKKDNFLSYNKTTLFKPNLKEVQEALPFPIDASLDSLQKASDFLRLKLNHQNTMITLSEKGIFTDDKKESMILPTQPRKIKVPHTASCRGVSSHGRSPRISEKRGSRLGIGNGSTH